MIPMQILTGNLLLFKRDIKTVSDLQNWKFIRHTHVIFFLSTIDLGNMSNAKNNVIKTKRFSANANMPLES